MKVIDDRLGKIRLYDKQFLGSGCYGKVYKGSNDKCFKLCKSKSLGDDFINIYDVIKDNNLQGFCKLISLLYSNSKDARKKKNPIGYEYQYMEKEDIDILTMPIDYTIDNLDVLYNSIAILTKNNIRCIDLQEGNVIMNCNSITALDIDLYCGMYEAERLEKYNVYDLELLFQYLYKDAMDKYHKGEYSNEVKQLLSSLFMIYECNGIDNVYRKLKSYKYPIEYVNKLKILSRR